MYQLQGKLIATKGNGAELAQILLQASELMRNAEGCKLYVIGQEKADENSVFVTEIWESKEHHDNSLKVAGVKELIMKAMPLLDGQPGKGQELEVLGGVGV